jgi:acetolactate synthase-1/2/3 large subunit
MRLADYVMNRLSAAGVRHVFLVTGRGALFLTDALAKHPELDAVSVHHEQSAAFAAIAYAHQTHGLGACLVSTGCASTNTMTGVLSAWQDGIPCVFISGQNILKETSRFTGIPLRTYGQQEADIVELVRPITKYARMITAAEEIGEVMDTALRLANSGRKGPVWIDIPLDLQSALVDPDTLPGTGFVAPPASAAPADDALAFVVEGLSNAKRPVVLIGSGVRSAGAETALRIFVERWQIPLTYAASAPDTYGSALPQSMGSVGSMGCSRAGNFAVQNADFLLVLGSRLSSLTTGPELCKFARAATTVVVDIDAVEHSKESVRIDKLVIADLRDFLDRMNAVQPKPAEPAWLQQCQSWKALFGAVEPSFRNDGCVDLYELADCLSTLLPSPSTVVTDSGLTEVILPTNIRFGDGMQCIHPASQGAMGFALPAAIGAAYAGEQLTLVVTGDGSIMMNLQELETIRYRKLPIKIVVINNNVYSIIRRRQRDLFRKRIIGTDPDNGISCPSFEKVAACFDLDYVKIENTSQLRSGLADVLGRTGPVLCEIMGRPDQEYIEIGQARSAVDRRLVRRPLEDQAPFLERTLFLSEMLVEPIDQ